MEKCLRNLDRLWQSFVQDEQLRRFILLQCNYEVILEIVYSYGIDGKKAIDLLLQILDYFKLTTEEYNLLLKELIDLINCGEASKILLVQRCFSIFNNEKSLLEELVRPIPKAITFDIPSFIFVKTTLLFLLQQLHPHDDRISDKAFISKFIMLFTDVEATTYLKTVLPPSSVKYDSLALNPFIEVVSAASEFLASMEIPSEVTSIIKKELEMLYKKFEYPEISAETESNIELLVEEIFSSDFPYSFLQNENNRSDDQLEAQETQTAKRITKSYDWKNFIRIPVKFDSQEGKNNEPEKENEKVMFSKSTTLLKRRYHSRSSNCMS